MKTEVKNHIASINLALSIGGYMLISSIFGGSMIEEGSSQTATIPYRIFALFVNCLALLVAHNKSWNINRAQLWAFLLWAIAFLRLYWTHELSAQYINHGYYVKQMLYLGPITLFTFLSVIKSRKLINPRLTVIYAGILLSVACVSSLLSGHGFLSSDNVAQGRIAIALSLSSISTGYMGLSLFLIAAGAFILHRKSFNILFIAACAVMGIIGMLIFLRAGSRGPVLTLMIIGFAYFLFNGEKRWKNVLIVAVIFCAVILSMDMIEGFIRSISPTLYTRLFDQGEQFRGRDTLYADAMNIFWKNPWLGGAYSLIGWSGIGIYVHNYFLDAMIQAGIIGLTIAIGVTIYSIKIVKKCIERSDYTMILAMLMLMSLCQNLVSGALYNNDTFFALLAYLSGVSPLRNPER